MDLEIKLKVCRYVTALELLNKLRRQGDLASNYDCKTNALIFASTDRWDWDEILNIVNGTQN